VNTVQFSNHTGYESFTGRVFTGPEVADVVEGVADRGVFARCDAVLSGYIGDDGIGTAVLDAVRRVRAANPAALYCCDPVIGDEGRGSYVRPGIPEFMRDRALPAADFATPNLFELQWLAGRPVRTLADARQAVARLQATMRVDGPRNVLVTSLRTDATPEDAIDMLAAEGGAFHLLRTPRLPINLDGSGDTTAALYLYHRLATGDAGAALSAAGSSIHGLLRRTTEAGSRELLTVAARDEILNPSVRYRAEPA
jgi:pyridoxine kinase